MPGLPDSVIDLVVARALRLAATGADEVDALAALDEVAGGDRVVLGLARARCESRAGDGVAGAVALLRAAEART